MDSRQIQHKPGDLILDRYMPNATPAEREQGRENLYAFFAVLLRIATRRAGDDEIRAQSDTRIEWESGFPPPL